MHYLLLFSFPPVTQVIGCITGLMMAEQLPLENPNPRPNCHESVESVSESQAAPGKNSLQCTMMYSVKRFD